MSKDEFLEALIYTMYKDNAVTLAFIRSLVNDNYDLAKDIFNEIINYQINLYGEQLRDDSLLKSYKKYRSYIRTYEVELKKCK